MADYLQDLVRFARNASPYYQELYAHLPDNVSLADLPIVDHSLYWAASNANRRSVMTSPQIDGVVMRTGGTTSRPKTSAYSQIELHRTTKLLARGLIAAGVRSGERLANMFYAGDLYASFLLHVLSVVELTVPVVHVPIGGLTKVSDAVDIIEQCEVTALLTTATSLVKISHHVTVSLGRQNERMRCIMYGGEPLFPEQELVIRKAFPRASIKSCIYGTVDSGVLAEAASDTDNRIHRALTEAVVIEIVREDGSGQPIEENGVPGLLVATNLIRTLSPVIRYPTGDRAVWVDKDFATFRLLGRAGQAVRLGPVSIDVVDLRSFVASALSNDMVHGVQAVVTRASGVDQLELVIAAQPVDPATAAQAVLDELYLQRPMCKQHVDLMLIGRPQVRFVDLGDLQLAPGSQKLIDVIERRFDGETIPKGPSENGHGGTNGHGQSGHIEGSRWGTPTWGASRRGKARLRKVLSRTTKKAKQSPDDVE